jgi:hypothetical protein
MIHSKYKHRMTRQNGYMLSPCCNLFQPDTPRCHSAPHMRKLVGVCIRECVDDIYGGKQFTRGPIYTLRCDDGTQVCICCLPSSACVQLRTHTRKLFCCIVHLSLALLLQRITSYQTQTRLGNKLAVSLRLSLALFLDVKMRHSDKEKTKEKQVESVFVFAGFKHPTIPSPTRSHMHVCGSKCPYPG